MKLSSVYVRRYIAGFPALVGLGVFFVLYSYLPYQIAQMSSVKLNAPDEVANYHFTKVFKETSWFTYPEPHLPYTKNFIHPRSMTADDEGVKPVGFLGLALLYGFLAKFLGEGAILFMTPFFALVGAVAFYVICARVFSRRVGLLSAGLLLLHPAYWYYASRSLMPNVLFVALCLVAFALLVVATDRNRRAKYISTLAYPFEMPVKRLRFRLWMWWLRGVYFLKKVFYLKTVLYFAAGVLFGFALMVRLSEILWLAVMVFLLGLCYIRRLSFWRVFWFLVGLSSMMGMLFWLNTALYGNFLSSGYKAMGAGGESVALSFVWDALRVWDWSGAWNALWVYVQPYTAFLLPFGYHPEYFVQNAKDFVIKLFPWFAAPTLLGGILLGWRGVVQVFRERSAHFLVYLFLLTGVSVWLVIFYGSWPLVDNIAGGVTLGVSYVRYWLPLYIMAVPLVAYLIVWLFDRVPGWPLRRACLGVVVAVFVFMGVRSTLWDGSESVFDVESALLDTHVRAEQVFAVTEEDAVIFSPRSDKLFFPERDVAGNYDTFPEAELVYTLKERGYPVYYYGLWRIQDAEYIGRTFFNEFGLHWEYVISPVENETLYRVVWD